MATMKYTIKKQSLEENGEEEKIIAQIGQTWSRSYLTYGSIKSTSIAVTKTHLFAVGKSFGKGCQQGYQSLDADLVNISSISFTKITDWVKMLIGIFLTLSFIPHLIMPLQQGFDKGGPAAAQLFVMLCIFLPIVIWCFISAIKRVISINVQGAIYNYKISSTSDDAAQMFVRKVRQLADMRRKEEKQVIVGAAPVDTAQGTMTITKEKINLLKSLYEEGLITREEFLAKAEEHLKTL